MPARPKLARLTALAGSALAACLGVMSCGEPSVDVAATTRSAALTAGASAGPGDLDVLFMIDNSSSMTEMQQKLAEQIPQFVTALAEPPDRAPQHPHRRRLVGHGRAGRRDVVHRLHVRSGTTASSRLRRMVLVHGHDASVNGAPRSSPTSAARQLHRQSFRHRSPCIALLGDKGCGFEHQLASVARALGADGSPAPASNAGFLRPNAQLAIILLSNEDDCSAPSNTPLYSLNVGGSNQQNIQNALGPVANYRCNAYGHLCVDAHSNTSCLVEPPNQAPADVQISASAVTLDLTECESAEGSGLLTSVQTFVQGIRSLKADPINQIVVGAIVAPASPYTVNWVPEQNGQNSQPGELWPEVEHSCGAAGSDDVNPLATQNPTDGSFGDPSVRITQFVKAFGENGIVGSVCDRHLLQHGHGDRRQDRPAAGGPHPLDWRHGRQLGRRAAGLRQRSQHRTGLGRNHGRGRQRQHRLWHRWRSGRRRRKPGRDWPSRRRVRGRRFTPRRLGAGGSRRAARAGPTAARLPALTRAADPVAALRRATERS